MPDTSQDPIIQYLAYFNQIDKHFDKVLGTKKFLPYNEKIKRIIQWEYPISWFVKLHKYELKFFGEIRNHITHGIKLDGHNYALPSEYALNKVKTTAEAIKKPPSCFDIFKKTVFFCKTTDLLKNILPTMKRHAYTHVPVYNEEDKFVGVLSESGICYRLAKSFENKNKSLEKIKIAELPYQHDYYHYLFVSKATNIYEIDRLFTRRKQKQKRLGAMFITSYGKESEQILWIITSGDVALVDMYVVH